MVIDDDPRLIKLLRDYLQQQGLQVVTATSVSDFLQFKWESGAINAVVLDLGLPDGSGFEVLAQLKRTQPDLPVVILSARGSSEDRISGLELGADDYLGKPFAPRELLLRLQKLMASRPSLKREAFEKPGLYRIDQATFDVGRQLLKCSDTELQLTAAEAELLALFCRHPNQVLHRDLLMQQLKGYVGDSADRTMDTRVKRLRQRIEHNPEQPKWIKTVWGKGYRLCAIVQSEHG